MKKQIIIILLITATKILSAQSKIQSNLQGGLWLGSNKQTTFVGFIGPKFSYTTKLYKKTKIEVGLNGVPGLILDTNPRMGMIVGATLTFKTENKIKPVVGVMFLKTKTWQPLYGIGFLF